jgi:hypothetical protein
MKSTLKIISLATFSRLKLLLHLLLKMVGGGILPHLVFRIKKYAE